MPFFARPAASLHTLRFGSCLCFVLFAGPLMPAALQAQIAFTGAPSTITSGYNQPTGVAVDASGNVYFTVLGANQAFKESLQADGTYAIAALPAPTGGFDVIWGAAVDSASNVYITNMYSNSVAQLVPSGNTYTASTLAISPGASPSGIAVDSTGNLYIASIGSNAVYLETANGDGTYTRSTVASGLGSGGPYGVAVDGAGNVYIADTGNGQILKETPSSGSYTQTTIASGLSSPTGVAVDALGDVYIADSGNNRVLKETYSGGSYTQSTIGSGFSNPQELALDSQSNLYVANDGGGDIVELYTGDVPFGAEAVGSSATLSFNFTVTSGTTVGSVGILTTGVANKDFVDGGSSTCTAQTYSSSTTCVVNVKFSPLVTGLRRGAVVLSDGSGNPLTTVYVYGNATGPQVAYGPGIHSFVGSGFSFPIAAAIDDAGNAYIADAGVPAVYKVAPGGTMTTVGSGYSEPFAVAVDGAGNVYVGDIGKVYMVTPAGVQTQLSVSAALPQGLAVDGAGNLYIANYQSPAVYKFTPSGTRTTIGSGFFGPEGVAVDAAGNVFVVDEHYSSGTGALYKITSGGTQTTIDSGLARPSAVAVDAAGNAYITDEGHSSLFEVSSGGTQTTLANGFGNPSGLALDKSGNLLVVDADNADVVEIDRGDAPSLSFATTNVGSTSSDSPHTVRIENIGNENLDLSALSYPTDFVEATGDSNACTGTTTLDAGGDCDLPIDFEPLSGGLLTESVSLTDNNLNVSSASQLIGVSGTGQAQPATHFSVTGPNPVTAGTPFTILVTALDASNHVASGYSGTVNFSTSTSAAGLPASTTLTNGNASFLVTVDAAGTQSITATDSVNASIAGTDTFTVNQAAASVFQVNAPSLAIAGGSFSFTVTAYDAYGNPATAYAGTVKFTSSDASATLPSPSTLTNGTGTLSATLLTAGSQTITATDSVTSSITGTSNSVTVFIPTLVVTSAGDNTNASYYCHIQATPGTGTDPACTLHDALLYAQTWGSASITFDSTVFSSSKTAAQNTITLQQGSLILPSNTTVTGPTTGAGANLTNLVTLSGGNAYSVISVANGVTNSSLNSLNLTGGAGNYGSGIYNGGAIKINQLNISGNASTESGGANACGAVVNAGGIAITDSTISNNSVTVTGGGSGAGGGICNTGSMSIADSTISGNTATAGGGGQGIGGGIFNNGSLTVINTTISGNTAAAGGQGIGGGIMTYGNLNLFNTTISNNTADNTGGLYIYAATTSITNSIISGDSATTNNDIYNHEGTLNQIAGNQIGITSIHLAPLGSYGGAQQTMVPLPGSGAICAGLLSDVPSGVTTDERGYPFDPNCPAGAVDAGAVQSGYALSFSTNPPSTVYVAEAITPAPAVTVTESGVLASAVSGSTVSVTDAATALSGTTTGALASGAASFPNLVIGSVESSDALTATLALSSSINLTAASGSFAAVEPTVQVTVGTNPAGLAFTVDGVPYTSAQTLPWTVTTPHTIATTTPQTGTGVSYAFTGWSDSGALSHTVTAALNTTSYTASFAASYELNIAVGNASYGTVTPTTGAFYASGTVVPITATPAAGYYFTGWTGSADIASSSSASTTVTMNGVETITANFAPIPNFVVTAATDDAGTASNCTAQTTAGTGTDASCSLRDALLQAAATGAGYISFDQTAFASAQTITLTNGTLTVPALTTITGPTSGSGATLANLVTVDGNSLSTVLTVNAGTESIASLTIAHGNAGGGYGGAILAQAGSMLTITGSALLNNTSSDGGAIFTYGGLTVTGSTFSANTAGAAGGGAIYVGGTGTATIADSTFNANTAGQGGAIQVNNGAAATVSDNTFTANTASGGSSPYGGAILNAGTLVAGNNIFAANTAGSGAGIYNTATANLDANVYYQNLNSGSNEDDCPNCTSNTNAVTASSNPVAPLGSYGGAQQTMVPLPGSGAICAGLLTDVPSGVTTDERGYPFDPNCPAGAVDAGAVQSNYALSFSTNPPASVYSGQSIAPAPVVQLSESGVVAAAVSSASVSMTDSASQLTGTDSASISSGLATFSNLVVNGTASGDTLTATLALSSTLNITATSISLNSTQATPTLTWNAPAAITYGTALSNTQLNATASVPGTFAYTPDAGAMLGAGNQILSVTFTPTDTTDYTTASTTVQLTVSQATPSITWSTPASITYGTALSGTQLDATSPVAGSFTYSPAAGAVLGAGNQTLSVTFTPTDATDYTTASTSVQLAVSQAVPTITWAPITPIPYGTALGATQLNATASVPGTFAYTPPGGTVLSAGAQSLSVTFTPTDSTDYTQATAGNSITVDQAASLTAPSSGSTLAGSNVTFSWTAGGGVTAYELWLGTTGVNSNNVYTTGLITSTSINVTVPTNGVTLYARLWSLINGIWQPADYVFTESGTPAQALLQSPSPGTTLSGANVTFTWSTGSGPTQYELWLSGVGAGLSEIYNSGQVTTTSVNVTNIPIYGVKLYARLWSRINGNWQYTDYTYSEAGTPVLATLTSPTQGTTFSGSSAPFTWTTGGGVTQYELWIGTKGVASYDVYNSNNVTATSANITGIPTNGVLLYITLWSKINNAWQAQYYTMTEAGTPAPASLTSPAPNSTLQGSSATFTWSTGTGPTQYELWIGTTGTASYDVYNSNNVTATSANVTGIPTNGVLLYVTLWSRISGNWQAAYYTVTEAGTPAIASLQSPTQGSTLQSSSATFTWSTGSGPTQYELWLGTTIGSYNVYTTNNVTTTSANVTGIPTNGVLLYVTLWSRINGTWQAAYYTVTEAGSPVLAALTAPSAASGPLPGASTTFAWTPGAGPTAYELWVGTTGAASSNVYNSGSLPLSTLSLNLNSIPTNGVNLYVTLWSRINGNWQPAYYTFTEAGAPAQASMLTPTPGTTLPSGIVSFTWTAGSGPTQYELWLGTTGAGSGDLYNSGQLTTTSTSVSGLPTTGATIYARLYSRINGNWQYTDYIFTEQ